jgi:hypothetical protein
MKCFGNILIYFICTYKLLTRYVICIVSSYVRIHSNVTAGYTWLQLLSPYLPVKFHIRCAEYAHELDLCSQFENRPVDAEYVSLMHSLQSQEISGHTYRGYTLLTQNDRRQRSIKVRRKYSVNGKSENSKLKHFRLMSVM